MNNNIRNFCIIAHIDHGKSTLADRLIEITGTISSREMKNQVLDSMDLEREKGITIKLQPIRMKYKSYILNLIDTPGHMDFAYEVSRSIACVEGAVLIVDATQGVQAQTLVNLRFAQEQNLVIIPVINKIDLPTSDVEKVTEELMTLLKCKKEDIVSISAKTGKNVDTLLDIIIEKVPAPIENTKDQQALIFDSVYDEYRGIISYVKVFSGKFKRGDRVKLCATGVMNEILEVGYFRLKLEKTDELKSGDIGYIITGQRDLRALRVGDTVTLSDNPSQALAGYKIIKPMVFAGIYSQSGDKFEELREAVEKLKLNDSSIEVQVESSSVFGFGFRCGCLGLLHLEIFLQRLRREYDLDLVVTIPSVAYYAYIRKDNIDSFSKKYKDDLYEDENGKYVVLTKPSGIDLQIVDFIQEPIVKMDIVTPVLYIGSIMKLATERRGLYETTKYLNEDLVVVTYKIPLSVILVDFYDKLKSVSKGYASMNYEFSNYDIVDLVKLDIYIASDLVEPLSSFVYRDEAYRVAKAIVGRLKDVIPKEMFEIKIQASIGAKIIASERISAMRKNVTAKLYGGDVTRKRKLLEKQKKGKKRMMAGGRVRIPQDAYLSVLKRD